MSETIQGKVLEYIEAMAAQLGVAAEYVWALMVQQMIVEGIVYSGTLIGSSLLFSIIALKLFKKARDADDYDTEALLEVTAWIVSIVAGVIVLLSVFVLPTDIMKIFNPEYYAIQEILRAIK